MNIQVSIIIPALNEEKLLPHTLKSIEEQINDRFSYEVIVVDNGSTDRTMQIARDYGAKTYLLKYTTIAGLRNYGVNHAVGSLLVFLDADVTITLQWVDAFEKAKSDLERNPLVVTGARCGVPETASWISKAWFSESKVPHDVSHIGSGHMITTRKMFTEAGGFPEEIRTGEDYAFCSRARSVGGRIVSNPGLKVIHHGVPMTLREFVLRESWHGLGDWASVKTFMKSKVAVATAVYILLHAMLLASIVLYKNIHLVITCIALIIVKCVVISVIKYRSNGLLIMAKNSLLMYFYFLGRSLALLRRLLVATGYRSTRAGR